MSFIDKIKGKAAGKVAKTPTLKVTMMGPRAVGKTSLMASIFTDARETVAGAGVYFRPSSESSGKLTKKKLQLQGIFSKRQSITDTPETGAIEASSTVDTFSFEMGKSGNPKSINIEIKDFPGEYLEKEPEQVKQFILDSNVIMVAIDTPYLMEENGEYNEEKNQIKQITKYLNENEDAIKGKLILLVPLKCERYFHDNRIEEVDDMVEKHYAPIIGICKNCNIACVVTPIQTLGHIEFDKMVDNTKKFGIRKLSQFRFWGQEPKFLPMFCVQPLYYTLTYLANTYDCLSKDNHGSFWERLRNTVISFLKDDDAFLHEIKKMGTNIVQGKMGYKILVSNTILNLK